jgi:hypothetical protein
MEVSIYLKKYEELGDYFAPDFGRENKVLSEFKNDNPILSERQITEFKDILQSNRPIWNKYFVADLLYLYTPFSKDLLEPLVDCAIADEDPSFNRIFIRPTIISFGIDIVTNLVNEKGLGDSLKIEGINRLKYWLHPTENWITLP